jgi:predicted extracellular nuclease
VTFPQALYITEFYAFGRYGEIVLATERQFQPTNLMAPGPDAVAEAEDQELSRIKVDDGRGSQNPDPAIHPNGFEFTLDNRFRGGDTVANATGVIDFNYGEYKLQPTQGADYTAVNLRSEIPPDVGGSLKVATFNVLNFFTRLDQGGNLCGPLDEDECRGADNATEYQRQLDKIVAGIVGTGADIVGLQEIENDVLDNTESVNPNPAHFPVTALVDALNAYAGGGTWAWVGEAVYASGEPGYNGYPVRNDIIYKPASVTPVDGPIALEHIAFDARRPDDPFDPGPGDNDPVGRPPLAQTFQENGSSEVFTVVVNHFKSKGSACDEVIDPITLELLWEDPEDETGQANCNMTRVAQAEALMGFVTDLQASTGDDDVLIIGDLNSYAKEDPIAVIEDGFDGTVGTADDFVNLLALYQGAGAYTYVFDGRLGNLDHALGSLSMLSQVTGTAAWHINADEPSILDYDTSYKKPVQDALYEPNVFRASDHDPVIVGLRLDTVAPELTVTVTPDMLWPPNHKYRSVATTVTASDNLGVVWWERVSVTSSEDDCCYDGDDLADDIVVIDDTSFELRAERYASEGRTYTLTYRAWDPAGNETFATAIVFVPHDKGKKLGQE